MVEDGTFDFADADTLAFDVLFIKQHLKVVAFLQPEKVDAPGINLRHRDRKLRIQVILFQGSPKRGRNQAGCLTLQNIHPLGTRRHLYGIADFPDDIVDRILLIDKILDLVEGVIGAEQTVGFARPHLGHVEYTIGFFYELLHDFLRNAVFAENLTEAFIGFDLVGANVQFADVDPVLLNGFLFLAPKNALFDIKKAVLELLRQGFFAVEEDHADKHCRDQTCTYE